MQVGEAQKIFIGGTWTDAVVSHISVCQFQGENALLVSYYARGYGETQPYLIKPKGLYGNADERMARSLLPPQYAGKMSGDFDWNLYGENVEAQKKIANAFVSKFSEFEKQGRGLYIFSRTKGSGKTLLACILGNEIIRRRPFPFKFVSTVDFINLVKDKSDKAEGAVNHLDNIYACRLLIFDDIGVQDEKQQWINEALFRLIDYRSREKLPTIFTSNLGMDQIQDERIADRIAAMSVPVKMPEKKIRRQLADRQTKEFLQSVLTS